MSTPPLDVRPDLDADPWHDLDARAPLVASWRGIGLVPEGMIRWEYAGGTLPPLGDASDAPSVMLLLTLPGGESVTAQLSWSAFQAAFRTLAASPLGGTWVDNPPPVVGEGGGSPRPTGSRGCPDCGAPPYSGHADNCEEL